MQQKTYDFLIQMRVPMLTFGGELMGEAIELVIQELEAHQFISLSDIEEELANKFHCSAGSADRRLRRAMDMTEFRAGEYPNPELEALRTEYRIETWSIKKFLYAAARRLMNEMEVKSR